MSFVRQLTYFVSLNSPEYAVLYYSFGYVIDFNYGFDRGVYISMLLLAQIYNRSFLQNN